MFKFNLGSRVVVNNNVMNCSIRYKGKSGIVVQRGYGILGDQIYWVSFEKSDFEGMGFYENELSNVSNLNLPNLF